MWQMMKFDPWQKFPTTQYVVTTFEFGYYLMQQVVGIMLSSYRCYSEHLPLNVMILLLDGVRKNSSILKTTQCINTGLLPLRFWGPAVDDVIQFWTLFSWSWSGYDASLTVIVPWILHYNPRKLLEASILKKCSEIHCPIKEDETWMTFNNTSQCPRQLR